MDPLRFFADGGTERDYDRGAPVFFVARPQSAPRAGYWAVVDHAPALEVLTHPDWYSSFRGTRPLRQRPPGTDRLLHNLDPPAHTTPRARGRELLRAVDRDLVRQIVQTRALDTRHGAFDAVKALAEPIASDLLACALGQDPKRLHAVGHASAKSHEAAARLLRLDCPAHRGEVEEANRSLMETIASCPVPAGGDPSEDTGLLKLMLQAGWVTVVDAVASALRLLAEAGPTDDPVTGALAVDELLRLASPIRQFARTTRCDLWLAGRALPEGAQVVVFFGLANRDPVVFEAPHALRLDRRPNPHLAFGAGPHRCLGEAWARSVLRAVLETLDTLRIRPVIAGAPTPRISDFLCGHATLPLRWRGA